MNIKIDINSSHFWRRATVLMTILLFIVAACTPDRTPEPVPEPEPEPPEKGIFVECLYSKVVTISDVSEEILGQNGIAEDLIGIYCPSIKDILSSDIKYNVHAITYRTVTPDGKPAVASGVIYYPFADPSGVIEISPICKSKGTCGTRKYFMPEILPGIVSGCICIIPDNIGNGSTSDLPVSYLQHENVAIVGADMRKAAKEFIYDRYHYLLPSESILFGYSLGGAGILSLAHLYEENPSYGIKVDHVFVGGGAYEPYQIFKAQIEEDRSDFASMPNIILSIMYYDHLDLDLNGIFKGPLLEHYEEWCDGWMSINRITSMIGTHPSGYLTEDFINGFGHSEKYESFFNALNSKNIPRDWKPKAKIHLSHATKDYYVHTICGDRMFEHLKDIGADVEYKKYYGSHAVGGVMTEIDFYKFLSDYL